MQGKGCAPRASAHNPILRRKVEQGGGHHLWWWEMKSIRRESKSPAVKRGHELSVLEEPMSALA